MFGNSRYRLFQSVENNAYRLEALNAKCLFRLCVAQTILAGLTVSLSVLALILGSQLGTGLWTGCIQLATGIIGMLATKRAEPLFVPVFKLLCGISLITSIVGFANVTSSFSIDLQNRCCESVAYLPDCCFSGIGDCGGSGGSVETVCVLHKQCCSWSSSDYSVEYCPKLIRRCSSSARRVTSRLFPSLVATFLLAQFILLIIAAVTICRMTCFAPDALNDMPLSSEPLLGVFNIPQVRRQPPRQMYDAQPSPPMFATGPSSPLFSTRQPQTEQQQQQQQPTSLFGIIRQGFGPKPPPPPPTQRAEKPQPSAPNE